MLTDRIFIFCQLAVIAVFIGLIPSTVKANHSEHPHRILKSASELDYPPFALVRQDGSAVGFSVELLKEVAKTSVLISNLRLDPGMKSKRTWLTDSLIFCPSSPIQKNVTKCRILRFRTCECMEQFLCAKEKSKFGARRT